MTGPHLPGYLAAHPLPTGITGALGLSGYQLLADVGGVGAGRLGPQAFLLVAPDPDPSLPDAGTQIALHHSRLRSEQEASTYVALAAQLGYLRMSGYRLAMERHGLRSKIRLVNPATGGDRGRGPRQAPGWWPVRAWQQRRHRRRPAGDRARAAAGRSAAGHAATPS